MTTRMSDVQVSRMIEMYSHGRTLEQIAVAMGFGREAVRRRLIKSGVKLRGGGTFTPEGRAKVAVANMRRAGIEVSDDTLAAMLERGARAVDGDSVVAMYQQGMTVRQIAKALGVGLRRVRKVIAVLGVTLRPVGFRSEEGRLRAAESGRKRKGEKCSAEACARIKAARLRWGEKNAKGLTLKPNGYIEHTRGPNFRRSQHRVLMEERLGRKLERWEVVHHVDHNRSNNDPSNLVVMSASEHTRLHNAERGPRQHAPDGKFLRSSRTGESGSNPE